MHWCYWSSQLLYKITKFVTTGLIQAQGSCKDKFARRDFPKLLELVKNICEFNNVCNDGSGNPSTNTDTQQTVQNVENNDTQQTVQNVDDGSGNPSTSTDTQQTVQNVDDGSRNPSTSTDTQQTVQNVDDGSRNPSTSTDTQQTVQNVDDGSGNPSTSTDTQQTVQNVDNNDTNVKEVFDSESTLTTPQTNTEGKYKHNEDSETNLKQGSHDINQNDHLYDKANSKCTSTLKGTNTTPDGTMPKPIVVYEDINIIQLSFVEALKSITNTQTLFIQQAEKSLQNALGNTISPLVDTINKLRMDLKSNLAIYSDSSKQNTAGCSIKEHSKFDDLQNKFEKRVESLENELRCSQNVKHKMSVLSAELE